MCVEEEGGEEEGGGGGGGVDLVSPATRVTLDRSVEEPDELVRILVWLAELAISCEVRGG